MPEHLYVSPKKWTVGNEDLEYVQTYDSVKAATADAEFLSKRLPEEKKTFHEGGPKRDGVRDFDWSQVREPTQEWDEKPEPGKILDIL